MVIGAILPGFIKPIFYTRPVLRAPWNREAKYRNNLLPNATTGGVAQTIHKTTAIIGTIF